MKLNQVVPWGRNLEEYTLMFNLSPTDLQSRILGCGDGPASFNTEMTKMGYSVISIDPIYQFSASEIQQRIQETYKLVISQVRQNFHLYNWQKFSNADELGSYRIAAMEMFLQDYQTGKAVGRYLPQALPSLNFPDKQFDLCLCSHLLFLYSEQLSLEFHFNSIYELLRVASEVRIFPLLQLDCQPSPYLEPIMQEFSNQGFCVELQTVDYEFQKGGNQMLKIYLHSLIY